MSLSDSPITPETNPDRSFAPTKPRNSQVGQWVESSDAESSDIGQALREFHVMVRYALGEGLPIDDETRDNIAKVELAQDTPLAMTERDRLEGMSRLIAAHGALAKVVAPATPKSLEATEPAPGWTGSFRRPVLVGVMILIALAAAIGFIATSVAIIDHPGISGASNVKAPTGTAVFPTGTGRRIQDVAILFSTDPQESPAETPANAHPWLKQLNWVFAAALGAVFYVLFTAHDYVKNRTYDPRYNSVYLIRFVLGLLAGLILANVAAAPLLNQNQTFRSLGPAVIALLGGFSTEAVYQVLQRLVDIMLAAIHGDNSDTAKAKASQSAQKELLLLADDPGVTPALLNKIHAAVQKVGQ